MCQGKMLRAAFGGLALLALVIAPAANAQSAENQFYHAYYLETARGEIDDAAQLYENVAADRKADAPLRAEAGRRAAACREELATSDFATLVPAETLAYAEFSRPGEQLTRLLDMLGLLAEDGQLAASEEPRVAISPVLVNELLGLRGAAVAITGFDFEREEPRGVAILHPGKIEALRGMIETALPAAAVPVEAIEGFPTYDIEGQVLVTLTKRLVLVSTTRTDIEAVVYRLNGEEDQSLATNPDVADLLAQRGDGLLFFCVNFKPVMPLVNTALAAAGTQSRELAMAQALLDLRSMRSLSGSLGVDDDGLYLNLALALEPQNRNLLFHFLRLPAIDRDLLKRIPSGAAFVMASALSEPGGHEFKTNVANVDQPITLFDLGREIFANVMSVAIFAVPTEAAPTDGPPVPPIAAIITVHDPAKSATVWNQILGVASLASGAGVLDGMTSEVANTPVHRYIFPEGISVYQAAVGQDIILTADKDLLARTLATRGGKPSIVDDAVLAPVLKRIGPSTTLAIVAHPARCFELGKAYMSPSDIQEAEPYVEMASATALSLVMEHSTDEFKFSTSVSGLPDVGPMISQMVAEMRTQEQFSRDLSAARHAGDRDNAETLVQKRRAAHSDDADSLWQAFTTLAAAKSDHQAAHKLGEELCNLLVDDALGLNNRAWSLLTDDRFDQQYDDLALKMARRANELTEYKNWAFLDTLALALFRSGDANAAVDTQRKALALVGDRAGRDEVEKSLARFEAAVAR